jgi:hypothetical protein
MSNNKKYLSILCDRFIPTFLRSEYTNFEAFIKSYLEYLEQDGKITTLIFDMLHYLDIDKIDEDDPYNGDDDVLELYIQQYISSFPLYRITDIDIKKLIKNAKDFYSSKGTEKSYDFIFRLMNHMGAFEFYYPGNHVHILSDSNHVLSGDSKIHDNYYSAFYTYEIRSTLYGYAELKDIVVDLLHPAGCKCFFLRIIESLGNMDPVLQVQVPANIEFLFEIDSAYQWKNFDTYNLIYEAGALTFEDLEDLTYAGIHRGIGKMTFADWGDTFEHMENSATNFDWYHHQLSAYTTLI